MQIRKYSYKNVFIIKNKFTYNNQYMIMFKITYYNFGKIKLPMSCLKKIRETAKNAQKRKNCGTLIIVI